MLENEKHFSFNYTVKRSKRKTVAITIDRVKGVTVKVPNKFRQSDIIEILKKYEPKIIKVLENNALSHQVFENGSLINYLGCPLKIVHKSSSNENVYIESECLVVNSCLKSPDQISKAIEDWFISEAVRVLTERTGELADRLGVKPTKVSFRSQKTRWGSCSSKGSISLNWKLIFAPIEVMDYVIIHELCHMIHMNHSLLFWSKVSEFDPKYKENKKWLKDNAHLVYWPLVSC